MAEPTNHAPRFRIPKFCKHKTIGQAVVRLNGKDVYCHRSESKEAKDKHERIITEWLQRGRQLLSWILGQHTLTKQVAQEGGVPASTLSISELVLASKLQTRTVAIRDNKRKKIGERVVEYRQSRRTINMRIDIIKRMIAWGVENELVPASVWPALQAVKGLRKGRSTAPEPKIVRPVPDADVEAVLPLVSTPVHALIKLQRLTGARSGELCIMRPCDIDRSEPVWRYRPTCHKNQHREAAQPREILIGPRGQAIVTPFLDRAEDAFLFSPREAMFERYLLLRGVPSILQTRCRFLRPS